MLDFESTAKGFILLGMRDVWHEGMRSWDHVSLLRSIISVVFERSRPRDCCIAVIEKTISVWPRQYAYKREGFVTFLESAQV